MKFLYLTLSAVALMLISNAEADLIEKTHYFHDEDYPAYIQPATS